MQSITATTFPSVDLFREAERDCVPLDAKAWRYQLNAIGRTIIHSFREYKSAFESARYIRNHSWRDNFIVNEREPVFLF